MAEAFLIAVAKSVCSTLASYIQKQLLLPWGLDSEVQKLEGTMQTINAVLRDVEGRGGGTTISHSDQVWLANLCSAVCDSDDVFDEIVTMAERKKVMEGNAFRKEVKLFFFSSSNQLITAFSLAQRVKSIRENLDGISKDRRDRKQVESRNLSDNVVGREYEKIEIISMLFDSNFGDNVCVILVVGVRWLGKSTLARYVWVTLPQEITLKGIMEKIIAATGENPSNWELEKLKICLSGLISGKKYIMVLDNVWNENVIEWRALESVLTLGAARGSRILLTTRSPIIAENVATRTPMELHPLEDDNSWFLLDSIVFGKKGCHDPKLKEIGLKI